jgi:60 kDa SS-A/Ro ribonucleoprotein
MKTNVAAENKDRTHEGAPARIPVSVKQLERQVATCMLWENTFYESGQEIAKSIAELCKSVSPNDIAKLAIKARNEYKLRHVPLFLLVQLNKRRDESVGLLKTTIREVVQRPDEMGELISLIAKDESNKGKPLKKVLSAQVKKGLAEAFKKFSTYQLSKWNRDSEIKLRDVAFLVHAKPKYGVRGYTKTARKAGIMLPEDEGSQTLSKLVMGTLESADTWEVALSSGKDKRETWERLLLEKNLGYMALLMNLRNMEEAGVNRLFVEKALLDGAENSRALPFRFISAYKHAPGYAQALSDAMIKAISGETKLMGSTALLVDVSGSMDETITDKSTLLRWEAAAALGILLREICESVRVFTFSESLVEVPNVRGISMIEKISQSQAHSGTYLGGALSNVFMKMTPDRVIVVTDEQSHDQIPMLPVGSRGYIVNVAPYRPSLMTNGRWTRVNGFSERLVDWIRFEELSS